MEIMFCEKWSRHYKEILNPLTPKQAKKRHDVGNKLYTVVFGDPEKPYCFIEINLGFHGVNFLDQYKRDFLIYGFSDIGNGRLFVNQVVSREYEADSDNIVKGVAYFFSQDGKVTIDKVTYSGREVTKAERLEGKADVTFNWENKPEFGHYDKLIDINRMSETIPKCALQN